MLCVADAVSRFCASFVLLGALSACGPVVDRSPPFIAPAPPPSTYPRAECNGPWNSGDARPAIPGDDASRERSWDLLAPERLPPPHQECMAGAPQTDLPQKDFGLASDSRPTPYDKLAPPSEWAAERPSLSSLLLPAIESITQSWRRRQGAYERIFTTTHWLGSVRRETLASFDSSARAVGLRLDDVERDSLAFTLRYVGEGVTLALSRRSRTEVELELAVTIPGDLRADAALTSAIAQRPLVTRLAQRATLERARRRGTRFEFFFAFDESRPSGDEAAREGLTPAPCPARGWKGIDPRRCYLTRDRSAFVVTESRGFDVLDEPHDRFD